VRFFRNRHYEIFYVLHLIGAALMLVGSYYHRPMLASWVYASVAFWAFDRFCRLARLAFVHVLSPIIRRERPGLVRVEAEVVSGAVVLRLVPTCIGACAGSHVYISFFGRELLRHPLLLGQNHPFSIASIREGVKQQLPRSETAETSTTVEKKNGDTSETPEEARDEMVLVARYRGGLTRWLASEVNRQGGKAYLNAFVEGPYGNLGDQWKGYDSVALFAAGSGITHVSGILERVCQHVVKGKNVRVGNVELNWVLRNLGMSRPLHLGSYLRAS
jgi:hypothetical protein